MAFHLFFQGVQNLRKTKPNEVVDEPDGTLSWSIREGEQSKTTIFFRLPHQNESLKFKFWSIDVLEMDPDIKITGKAKS